MIDERIERSEGDARTRQLYEEYRSIVREMVGRLGELVAKMHADRVLDPKDTKVLVKIATNFMRC